MAIIIKILNDKKASSGQVGKIIIWNIENGECFRTINAHSGTIWNLAKLSDDKIVSSSDDQTIKVWDIKTGDYLIRLQGHDGDVFCIDII